MFRNTIKYLICLGFFFLFPNTSFCDVFQSSEIVVSENISCSGKNPGAKHLEVYSVKPISHKMILPTSTLVAKKENTSLRIRISKNEYEPISIVIRTLEKPIEDLSVVVSHFGGKRNPSKNFIGVDIKWVKTWFQANGAWKSPGRPRLYADKEVLIPELLLNDNNLVKVDMNEGKNILKVKKGGKNRYIDISSKKRISRIENSVNLNYTLEDAEKLLPIHLPAKTNKQVWLNFHASNQIEAGTYLGSATILSKGEELCSISISLEVLDIELPPPSLDYLIYYQGILHISGKGSLSSSFKSSTQLKSELVDIVEHGFDNATIYQDPKYSSSLMKKHLNIRKESGMPNDRLFMIMLNTERLEKEKLRYNYLKLERLVKNYGVNDIYIYGRDEAKGEHFVEQLGLWKYVKTLGGKIFVAGYESSAQQSKGLLDMLIYARSPDSNVATKFHRGGNKIYSYANPQSGVENPEAFRANYGFLLWASGFDGAMVYAYQHSMGNGWNDFDHRFRDHNFTYPTSNGVIGTLAWEGMREAIDDVRYISELENMLRSCNKNSAIKGDVVAIEKWIAELKHQFRSYQLKNRVVGEIEADLDDIRGKIARDIVSLNSGCGSQITQ